MNKPVITSFILISSLLIAACSSAGPKRAMYSGADTVSTINANSFIGTWQVKVLNPAKGEPSQDVRATYRPDGTAVSIVDARNSGNPMADMVIETTSDWRVEGDFIIHENGTMRETSGNKVAGIMTGIMSQFVSSMQSKGAGTANVYLLEPNRIVLVSEGSDRVAQELIRIR
jgi:hypothetical protein